LKAKEVMCVAKELQAILLEATNGMIALLKEQEMVTIPSKQIKNGNRL
jgi:hypothetical protein